MATLKIYSEIVDSTTKVMMEWDGLQATTSDDVVKFIDGIPDDDSVIDIRINCIGGDVFEGWRIYDALRHSGKTISALVEGMCASMATVILMAAPKERRHSYPNASFCIHNPETAWLSSDAYRRLTADNIDKICEDLKSQAEMLRNEQKKIIDLYVERTGTDAETLQALMNEDVIITAERAKELGLISRTLAPTTAKQKILFNNMEKSGKTEVSNNLLTRLLAKLGFASIEDVKFNDLTFTAANGTEFTVEREEGKYAVGDVAKPDGRYVMDDGSTVVIENDRIADIVAPVVVLRNPKDGTEIGDEEAQQLLNDLYNEVKDLREKIDSEIEKAKNEQDALKKSIADYENEVVAQKAQLDELTSEFEGLKTKMITDEQRQMLDTIETAGGKKWFDVIIKQKSDGAPHAPQADLGNPEEKRLGEGFLQDLAKRQKRIR